MDDMIGEGFTTKSRMMILSRLLLGSQSRQCYDNLDLVGHNIFLHIFRYTCMLTFDGASKSVGCYL